MLWLFENIIINNNDYNFFKNYYHNLYKIIKIFKFYIF